MGTFRSSVLLAGFILAALLMSPVQWLLLKMGSPLAKKLPNFYHRYLCWLIGIRVHVVGERYKDGACLLASNHTSWIDIPILGSITPLSFVAKSEVGAWPFFGMLARLQETVFVERDRRTKAVEQRNEMHARIAKGDTLLLFPEGTSSDGNRTLPFKSALMSVAQLAVGHGDDAHALVVQPVSIAYTKLCGLPMGRQYRPFFAWYGDMDLFPHLWEAFSLGPIDVVVAFHEPVTLEEHGNRKQLAKYCGDASAMGVARAVLGRDEIVTPKKPAAANDAAGSPDEKIIAAQ
ncbi:MAG: 1-acyl-sn-glycerol-3-phosphate acyltransferase [Parvibaculaceae bacterium]|jgi:1-acyl-sn-glycerol-3-phosphate acyltransferase|nr:lysophospholipid acyltransferase family protein [Parvibaculaceae bacterium]